VTADIGESARGAVVAADDEDALAQNLQRPPVAGPGDVAGVADDLPAGPDQPRHFDAEIFGIAIDPAGQAELLLGIMRATRKAGDFRHAISPLPGP